MHVVLTGRGAPAALIEAADLVSEMRAIKHPFEKGVMAIAGVDF
jgi:cob(I)alamin adenosyltransferase